MTLLALIALHLAAMVMLIAATLWAAQLLLALLGVTSMPSWATGLGLWGIVGGLQWLTRQLRDY